MSGVAFPLSGAQFFVQSWPKVDNERRGCARAVAMHRAPASEVTGLGLGSDVCHREGVFLSTWPFSSGGREVSLVLGLG